MFFNDYVRGRLTSLLQPWLIDEPDLELKLGLLRSDATLKNINFRTSALNQLLDDSSCYRFTEVTVRELSLRFSYWSFPAISLLVHGFHFKISLGEDEAEDRSGNVSLKRKTRDPSVEEKRRVLAEIDPEGSALHDAVEKISKVNVGNWRDNLLSTVFRYSQLQMDDIHVTLAPPSPYDSVSCLLEIKEVGVKSDYIQQACFLGGLISSFLATSQAFSLNLHTRDFTIVFLRESHINYVVSPINLFVSIKMENLQFSNSIFNLPSLYFSFTPEDLSLISLFLSFASKESKCARSGRHLWRIAASRISYLTHSPKLSWNRVASSITLWQNYLHTYEKMLLIIGYPAGDIVKESFTKMFSDRKFSRSVKHHWYVLSECEVELPSEAIAQARRITRHRVSKRSPLEKQADPFKGNLWKVFHVFSLCWVVILKVLQHLIKGMLYLLRFVARLHGPPKNIEQLWGLCDASFPKSCFYLNVGIISISLFPEKEILPNIAGISPSAFKVLYDGLVSFHISFDAFLLQSHQNFSDRHMIFSCACIKVATSVMEDENDPSHQKLRGQQKKINPEAQVILWCEPAQRVELVNDGYGTGLDSIPLLELLVRQMWLNWKKSCTKLERNDFRISEAPCILFESNFHLIDEKAESPKSGFHEAAVVVGRLNFVIGNTAILSLAVLYRQIQRALWGSDYGKDTNLVWPTSTSHENLIVVDSEGEWKSVFSTIETRICKMIPEKNIQIGVMISGPRFRLLVRKEKSVGGDGDLYPESRKDELELSSDLEDTMFVISPNSITRLSEPSWDTKSCDEQFSSLRVEEPDNIEMSKPTNEIYSCHGCLLLNAYLKFNGMKAYLGGLSGVPGKELLILSAITSCSSFSRKDHHSFGSTSVATSATVNWIASGFTTVLFLDELSALVEVVSNLYNLVLQVFTFFGSNDLRFLELPRENCTVSSSRSGEICENGGKWICPVPIQSSFGLEIIFELNSIDVVLDHSRKNHNGDNYMIQAHELTSQKLTATTVLNCGIHFSIQLARGRFCFGDGVVEHLIDLSVIRCVIVRHPIKTAVTANQMSIKNLLHSMKCLCEASLSSCKFYLSVRTSEQPSGRGCWGSEADASTSCDSPCLSENFYAAMKIKGSRNDSLNWLIANIDLGEIYLAEATVKKMIVKRHKTNNLNASVSAGEKFQTVCCKSEGGAIFLETEALLIFVQCLTLYSRLTQAMLPSAPPAEKPLVPKHDDTVETSENKSTQDFQQLVKNNWRHVETFCINLTQFTLAVVSRDEFGRSQELLFEANAQLDLEVSNMLRKVSFGIPKFSILSRVLHETAEQKYAEIQVSHFSSATCNEDSPSNVVGGLSLVVENENDIHHLPHGSSSTRVLAPQNEPFGGELEDLHINGSRSTVVQLSPQSYILKELCVAVVAEWSTEMDGGQPWYLNQLWLGDGSITGLEMNLSLTQLQVILSVVESLSTAFTAEKRSNSIRPQISKNQESEENARGQVPDGIVVAIEDVYQHTFIATEAAGTGYELVGTVHYSLVGEKALFRVKHHNTGRWKPRIQYFSLISLYAKDASGEPLRLSSQSRSDFVGVSVSTDTPRALWSTIPYRPETYSGHSDWESDSFSIKNTFYLVNKKNDQSVAFHDGVLEFVSKPGNLFKWKFFHEMLPPGNSLPLTSSLLGTAGPAIRNDLQVNDNRELRNGSSKRGITIVVNKATLTIVHELSDTTEKFPLLQVSINSTEFIIQISERKARFMTWLEMMLLYFDSQRNLWRELVSPLEICIFFRYRFLIQGPENVFCGVPGHFFAKIKELNISLSELSLDVLLFVIGKLKLAGPFAVRSNVIFANCCKIENKSGLTLLCQFYDGQHVTVAGRQTNVICLRHVALPTRPPEASFFSIQLADKGLSTYLIHLSLLEAAAFTWRARLVSPQESKTFPGPFVVVEVSQKNEDGLSIVVSPLLRIHNETDFSLELRFQRPQGKETEFASLVLKAGESIDDSMATFGGTTSTGGIKKAFTSLSIGNFLFSFRPTIADNLLHVNASSVEWSDELKGGKPVPLSGIFEKLSYQVRAALAVESVKNSFSTAHCSVRLEGGRIGDIYFLIQSIGKDVPVIKPDNMGYVSADKNPPIALQEQKEIFLCPTVHVTNSLEMDIHVNLTDSVPQGTTNHDNLYREANIPCGSDVNFYANPSNIFFTVTLTAFDSSCKPVSSSLWAKKLQKQKKNADHLDIELDFGGGKYFAYLRLSRGQRGILEAAIYTPYTLRNDTENALYCFGGNQKPPSRDEVTKFGSRFPPELGVYLPPNSRRSWLIKYPKVWVKLVEEQAFEALLNLDSLSRFAQIDLEAEEKGSKEVTKLGISLKPSSVETVPSLIVSISPRHVVLNKSEELIFVRQCYLEDDRVITVNSKQRTALKLQNRPRKNGETTVFENLLRKHSKPLDDHNLFIQFRLNDSNSCWSGPVCVASLGRFFLKFRGYLLDTASELNGLMPDHPNLCKFALVHVVEEDSTLVLQFQRSPNVEMPYRIENCLRNTPVTYYQKGSSQPDILGSCCSVDYVWDDLTLPHKLVVQLDDIHLLREINLDKVHAWKPFYRAYQRRGMGLQFPVEVKSGENKKNGYVQLISTETMKLGYEVYAEGLTRVLRICEFSDRHQGSTVLYSSTKLRFGISYFALQLLEFAKKDEDVGDALIYQPIIIIRLENIHMYSMVTDQHNVNDFTVKSLTVEEKRVGAPFAAMLRKHQSHANDTNDCMLQVVLVLLSSGSAVTHIKYLSIILQPLDLNLDEETLMGIVPFWRKSLSDPNAPSRQYYFDHFEIHPIKIVASFLPVDMYSSYTSTQEMLRSLLHSVIKIPTIKNKTMELNGVLVTHALITLRELSIKCAQHYSWYTLRAIYIAKGSPLLPPSFASMFDDFSSSSLDVFFDPSSGMINLPGLTMGTFKFIKKCIDAKGFSGTKRYFGDLEKTLQKAGSNILFAAVTEVSDSVLKGAETNGFNGMMRGFRQGILNLAMEPSLLGSALMEGGPDRKILLDRAPGVDELYIEGYLQALLDALYKQEYLRVRVIDNQVILKNLPPNSSLINEIVERVKGFLVSRALLKGDSTTAHSFRRIRGENEWRIGPTVLTLFEHLFVSFAIRILRKQAGRVMARVNLKEKSGSENQKSIVPMFSGVEQKLNLVWRFGIGKFILSGIVAYIDGRLCRSIPNPIARRVVSGFLLSFLDKDEKE
ncbi:OLC1v1010021C1 [Oldenlandia corymbosa var. corymbosa]|uniref:OLC1v1010021C1 n=1 Tax=Oldenlandia corymbosa var. corymbosa TaxID=529605 RepID=A0AAV1DQV3_OLDCO|nr:OLC1v1010021C1 [Oldenlandia corymbosa var. corymbosa]